MEKKNKEKMDHIKPNSNISLCYLELNPTLPTFTTQEIAASIAQLPTNFSLNPLSGNTLY